jgi:hypothetical protein
MDLRVLPITLLLGILAGCGREPAPAAADAEAAAAVTHAAAPSEVTEATAQAGAAPRSGSAAPAPIAPDAIAYFGFKAAPFGSDEKMLRNAWRGELTGQGPEQADGCHYLYPVMASQAPGRPGIGFMFERGRFVRIDVDDPALVAPGGGRIGMSTHEIASRYVQRAEVQPHEYVDGAQYLRVPDAGGSGQVLLFETDADRRVIRWRIGTPPQIDHAEGCA